VAHRRSRPLSPSGRKKILNYRRWDVDCCQLDNWQFQCMENPQLKLFNEDLKPDGREQSGKSSHSKKEKQSKS
jgi:hypothetical protein